jgi:hypothetical protein
MFIVLSKIKTVLQKLKLKQLDTIAELVLVINIS